MFIENPTPSELKGHQIAYYTALMHQPKSEEQKRFLRGQLFNLKKKTNVTLRSFTSVFDSPVFGKKDSGGLGRGLN